MIDLQEVKNLFKERLRLAREKKGLNKKELSEKLGMADTSYGQYEDGKNLPKWENLFLLSEILEIPVGYLLALDKVQVFSLDSVEENQNGNIIFIDTEEVRAGTFKGYYNITATKDQYPRVSIPGFDEGELFMFPVRGESMKPFITNGDMLIAAEIKDLSQITSGNAYVFAHANDGIVVKRLYYKEKLKFEARSDNPDYPPFDVSFTQDDKIFIVKGVLTANTSKR